MGNLSEKDFKTYMDLFDSMMMLVEWPDLMIYLQSSVPHLIENIQKRGRGYEQTMQIEYLKNLNDRYNDFIFEKYKGKVLVIDVDHLDFLNDPDAFRGIVDKIDNLLFGLFPE